MTQKMLELSQKFPFPGKRRLRSEVAAEQAQSDEYSFQDKVNEVRAKVVTAYWNLSLAYSDFDLTQRSKQVWDQVVKVAETRYAVGQGQQADVLQAQVELGNYLDRLLQWTQKQESFQADLNALRAKPPQTAIGRPQPLKPRPFQPEAGRTAGPGRSPAPASGLQDPHCQTGKGGGPGEKRLFPRYYPGFGLWLPGNSGRARGPETGQYVQRVG